MCLVFRLGRMAVVVVGLLLLDVVSFFALPILAIKIPVTLRSLNDANQKRVLKVP